MNRLSAVPVPLTHGASPARSSRSLIQPVIRRDLPQCVLAPQHYERNYAYPLLVWLHDDGGDERQLKQIMPLVSLRNYVSLAVRGVETLAVRGVDALPPGFAWPQSADAILAAESRLADAVAAARQRFNVHRDRIFLAGAGNGGTMALRLALRSPHKYAAAASIGGCFPQGNSPLARLEAVRRSRLLIMHCRDSETYSVGHVCDELALFHAAGLSVTLRQYPCADEITTQMLHDLDVWFMEQVTGVATADAHEPALPSDWN